MSNLLQKGKVIQTICDDFQTKVRGTNREEYDIYISCADDGRGMDITTGGTQPLKTLNEWLNN